MVDRGLRILAIGAILYLFGPTTLTVGFKTSAEEDYFAKTVEICMSLTNVSEYEARDTLDMYNPNSCMRKCQLEMLDMLDPEDSLAGIECAYDLSEVKPVFLKAMAQKWGERSLLAAKNAQDANKTKDRGSGDAETDPSDDVSVEDGAPKGLTFANNQHKYKLNSFSSQRWAVADAWCSCEDVTAAVPKPDSARLEDDVLNAGCSCVFPLEREVSCLTADVHLKVDFAVEFEDVEEGL